MREPLDFSSSGSRRATPPPQKAPRRAPTGTGSSKVRIAAGVVAVVAMGATGFLVFGGNGKNSSAADAEKALRYCGAARDFDRLVPNPAPGVELDTSVPAMSRLVEQLGGTLVKMKADAPADIRSDLGATVTALQEAAKGKPAGIRSPSFQEHRQRIASVDKRRCAGGAGGGNDNS